MDKPTCWLQTRELVISRTGQLVDIVFTSSCLNLFVSVCILKHCEQVNKKTEINRPIWKPKPTVIPKGHY